MVYKIGSRGQVVKDIQEVVGSGVDGIFGPATAEAVKKWQRANKLNADGLVGPATLEAMDLLDTDVSEQTYTTERGKICIMGDSIVKMIIIMKIYKNSWRK